ncbi:MAG TPA: transketolase [Actinomycetota bacterium]|nr:transketolase [Actinomycetota bacterium]
MSEALTAGKAGVDGALVESGVLSGSISLQPLRPTRGAIASAHLAAMAIRLTILEQAKRAGVGHIGSALSVADIVAALYSGGMDISDPDAPNRDRLVLSKGHAALALYAALHQRGWLTREELNTYCEDGSLLGVHPEHRLRGVDFSTGSLGHGLALGAGAALAARLQGSSRRVFVLLSDGECNEGSIWESAMFAAHQELSNLVVVIDMNGQQALGYTRHVLDLEPMDRRWDAFGWDARVVDGHDVGAMLQAFDDLDPVTGPPHVLVARTTFGRGVSFMENQIRWHYFPMSDQEYARAVDEVRSAE